eukprot:jgi/Chlat1/2254/Chrsp17S02788
MAAAAAAVCGTAGAEVGPRSGRSQVYRCCDTAASDQPKATGPPLASRLLSSRRTSTPQTSSIAWVPPPLPSSTARSPRAYSPSVLAFLGDAVWELYARRCFLAPLKVTDYHQRVVAAVRAEAQDAHVQTLLAGDYITDDERDVLRWGRNAAPRGSGVPKRLLGGTYRNATALECLVGYLYLSDPARLQDLMSHIGMDGERAVGS